MNVWIFPSDTSILAKVFFLPPTWNFRKNTFVNQLFKKCPRKQPLQMINRNMNLCHLLFGLKLDYLTKLQIHIIICKYPCVDWQRIQKLFFLNSASLSKYLSHLVFEQCYFLTICKNISIASAGYARLIRKYLKGQQRKSLHSTKLQTVCSVQCAVCSVPLMYASVVPHSYGLRCHLLYGFVKWHHRAKHTSILFVIEGAGRRIVISSAESL
jgi:hypothetical protein